MKSDLLLFTQSYGKSNERVNRVLRQDLKQVSYQKVEKKC